MQVARFKVGLQTLGQRFDGLKALKAARVSDQVIKVMINPERTPVSVAPGGAPSGVDPNLPPPEVGVYWKDAERFIPIEGQALSRAKVGGRAGSLFTYGVRGQHWDACIDGASLWSQNRGTAAPPASRNRRE